MLAAYVLFILTEYAVWIAMLVFAYTRSGVTIAGLVAVAQLVPAAVVAPVAASLADRRSPVVLLAGGYLTQAAAMAGEQGALSWELRIGLSLCGLRATQGRSAEGRAALASLYDRFTEGFATSDLVAAQQLLQELGKSDQD